MTFSCSSIVWGSSCDGDCQYGYAEASPVSAHCIQGNVQYSGQCIADICYSPSPVRAPGTLGRLGYGNNEDCPVVLQTDPGGSIEVAFQAFSTEANCDFVTLYDGANTSAPVLGRYSGRSLPAAVRSTGPSMLVRWTSGSYSSTGWQLTFVRVLAPCSAPSPPADLHMAFPMCGPLAVGSTCNGHCQAGYTATGTIVASCNLGDLTYSGQCVGLLCSTPSPPPSFNVTFPNCGRLASGDSCAGLCAPGYTAAAGTAVIAATCVAGTMTYVGRCTPVDCQLPNISGYVFPASCNTSHGGGCLGSCPPGYSTLEVIHAACRMGNWRYSGRCILPGQTPTGTPTETETITGTVTATASAIPSLTPSRSSTLTPSATRSTTPAASVTPTRTGFIRTSRIISKTRFPRLMEHALRSYLTYEDCSWVLTSPQLPYSILSDRVTCHHTGSVTAFIDHVDGVQWVALGASAKNDVLGWLPGFANATYLL
eukprot:EG_transcript_7304